MRHEHHGRFVPVRHDGAVGSVAGSSGAAGTIETTVALKSTAPTPCVLGGYPGLQLLTSSGASLPTKVVRTGNVQLHGDDARPP